MIKQIQLRGISRSPSDRMTSDGGCAESLNVHIEENELAPTQAPQNKTSTYCSSGNEPDNFLFVHKWGGYEHMIGIDGQVVKYYNGSTPATVLTLGQGETFSDIKSVGNTLIVASSGKLYYALWDGTIYKYIGNQIPIPQISFRIGNMTKMRADANVDWDITQVSTPPYDNYTTVRYYKQGMQAGDNIVNTPSIPHSYVGETHDYGNAANRYVFEPTDEDFGVWNEYLDGLWAYIDSFVQHARLNGKVVFPMFIRYAVRLYDGTVYAQSIPILLGADVSKFIDIKAAVEQWYTNNAADLPSSIDAYSLIDIVEPYSVYMNTGSQGSIFNDWKDIVTGVDLFISPQMFPLLRDAAKFKSYFLSQGTDQGSMLRNFRFYDFSLDPYYTENKQEELVKNYMTTFLAKSYTVEEFSALSGDVILNDLNFSSDWIMTQEALKETPGSMHLTIAKDLFTYNKKLMLGRASQKLSHGYGYFPSSKWGSSTYGHSYYFVFHIRGENGECVVCCMSPSGNDYIASRTSTALVNGSSTSRTEGPCAWIAYPDARCYKVDIYYETSSYSRFKASYLMIPSTQLDVAYAFIGFGIRPTFSSTSEDVPEQKQTISYGNSLLVSKFSNPFVFDTADILSLDGKVLNVAVITHPLSQGQVGQYELYVFTDEGIYALSTKEDGSFSRIYPVSRDVLVAKTALVAIEQGVFFVTNKGVMLLQGMTITDISKHMIGLHYAIDSSIQSAVQSGYLSFVNDTTPFMSFMASAHIAFDYTGKRLIFFNSTKAYQYVYMIETQTWHKIGTSAGAINIINSYPECLVGIGGANGASGSLYDFSTVLDHANYMTVVQNPPTQQCVIITRPFDLDEPDVRKTIKDIRIRGRFNRNDVKYLLLGSFDGINWKRLPSLRGGSYKFFRLFIRASLAPTERISWVDVNYESRMATKLR